MLVACNDFVLVRLQDAAKHTDGGILLPDTVGMRRSHKADVIAVAPLVNEQYGITVGDVVIVNEFYQTFVVDGEQFGAVRGTDVVCYVKKA